MQTQPVNNRQRLQELLLSKRMDRMNKAQKKKLQPTIERAQQMLKDPRVKPEMIDLYLKACDAFPTTKVPSPLDILDNPQQHQSSYNDYVANLRKIAIEQEVDPAELLSNPYGNYLKACLLAAQLQLPVSQ